MVTGYDDVIIVITPLVEVGVITAQSIGTAMPCVNRRGGPIADFTVTKIVQGWPKLWASFKTLIGIFSHFCWAKSRNLGQPCIIFVHHAALRAYTTVLLLVASGGSRVITASAHSNSFTFSLSDTVDAVVSRRRAISRRTRSGGSCVRSGE